MWRAEYEGIQIQKTDDDFKKKYLLQKRADIITETRASYPGRGHMVTRYIGLMSHFKGENPLSHKHQRILAEADDELIKLALADREHNLSDLTFVSTQFL